MARPRNVDRIDIPARAVEAAARLFAERGADSVTLAEVAAAAGCRAPALYRYFRSKEALLLAVHDEGFRRLYASKLGAAEGAGMDAFGRLRQGGLAYIRFAEENPHLYALMFDDAGPRRELGARRAADPAVEDDAVRSLAFLTASVRGCQAEGYLPGIDPHAAAFTFWSTVHGAIGLARRRATTADQGDHRRAPAAPAAPAAPFAPFDRPAPGGGIPEPERAVATIMALVAATKRD